MTIINARTISLFNPDARMSLVVRMFLPVLLLFTLLRLGLTLCSLDELKLNANTIATIFTKGLIFDLSFYAYACMPFMLYCWFAPKKFWNNRWHQYWVHAISFLTLYGVCFIGAAEIAFWQEFNVRFNFISVDYLVYSREVASNIYESYPVVTILLALLPLAFLFHSLMYSSIKRSLNSASSFKSRSLHALTIGLIPLLCYFLVGQSFRDQIANVYERELSSNGPFQFFSAFRNNELDYEQFYQTLPVNIVSSQLRTEVTENNASFSDESDFSIGRFIDNPGIEKQYNVILISVESLSANFLSAFGNTQMITPNLDALVDKSLFFENFYATGTRTTRGLEAITLSIPPTPGQSIVKRIGREKNMWSLGNVLGDKGYSVRFLYGGRGYFDNMNAFFSGNGYAITDQSSIDSKDILFENAWGVADEDLFSQTLKEANITSKQNQPFFFHVMTTSNHRPYTYPDNRIDIPSGTNREGAVKYTDFALGKFLTEAQQQSWFDQTLFVIVSDHCASSAGRIDLPIDRYHIPMWIYAPKLIKPSRNNTLASQMDIAPTILGLLNMSYESWFFGKNILTMKNDDQRALISNYQKLGYLTPDSLTILVPGKKISQVQAQLNSQLRMTQGDPILDLNESHKQSAIAFYQGSSYIYQNKLNQWATESLMKIGSL